MEASGSLRIRLKWLEKCEVTAWSSWCLMRRTALSILDNTTLKDSLLAERSLEKEGVLK